jgi:hypothetical protein
MSYQGEFEDGGHDVEDEGAQDGCDAARPTVDSLRQSAGLQSKIILNL